MTRALGVLALLTCVALPARAQECVASAAGAFSHDVRVSPRAVGACLYVVTVYEGASCEAARRTWSAELGCSEARRMRVTDRGRLVSILAPRVANPLWPIVRVFAQQGTGVSRVSLRLRDIAGTEALRGPARMAFEGTSLVMTARAATRRVEIDVIEAIRPP